MIVAFLVISLIHACHPPAVALASIPVLLHPGHWFPLAVVLPFTAVAVVSTAAMSRWLRDWPEYPKPLREYMPYSRVSILRMPERGRNSKTDAPRFGNLR